MSLLRFSHIQQDELWAPDGEGRLDLDRAISQRLQQTRPGGQGAPPQALIDYLAPALDAVPENQPIVVMVHGFDFDPMDDPAKEHESENPHATLFHCREDNLAARSISWPRRFGFEEDDNGANGLAIAYGWESNTSPFHLHAYNRGSSSAWGLIAILAGIHSHQRGRRVHLIAHSLGTHVVLHCLRILACNEHVRHLTPVLHRILLLGGSEFVYQARHTYRSLEKTLDAEGTNLLRRLEIYNLMSRVDEVVSTVSGVVTYGPLGTEKHMIGYHGLQRGQRPSHWMDLVLSAASLQQWLDFRFGLTVSGDGPERLDHWHYYVHRDNTELMKRILRGEPGTAIAAMRRNNIPDGAPQLDKQKTSWAYENP